MDEREKDYFKEIKIIEKKYNNIVDDVNLSYPIPTNFKSEKKKFFNAIADDKYYNPKFKFEINDINQKTINELQNFKINTSKDIYGFKKLYKQKIKTKILQLEYHKFWGTLKSVKYIKKFYGTPSKILLSKAKNICNNFERETVKFNTITPRVAGNMLKKEVKRLTGNKIQLKYTDINSKVNITPHHNIIKINPNERFTTLDVKRLNTHEIGVHYMRYFNGFNSKIKILEIGTSNYIETEEGLATYCEGLAGVSSKAQIFIYAGRVIATYYAQTKSFYEIYEILRYYGFNEQVAFTITYRAKRNMSDTSKPGGFTKDYVYLKGFFKIHKYAKKHDIRDLFIGKIKVEDVKILRKYIDKNSNKIKTIFDEEFQQNEN